MEARGTGKKETDREVVLSDRLRMLAGMVTPGNRLADVGCDHGFLSIYLVQRGICPGALAMDVREGPLAAAREHVKDCGLENYISLRLSDGLDACGQGEADTLVCAGMGGRLMERILRRGMERAREMKELILQPQSELAGFRAFLRETGFTVTWEDAVREDGKYYFAMKASCRRGAPGGNVSEKGVESGCIPVSGCGLYDLYGKMLLEGCHPVLLRYLKEREELVGRLADGLAGASGSPKAQARLEEVRGELAGIEQALAFFEHSGGRM